jgi:hypothetical protein
MTSTHDLISHIPSYMVEIISSHILGDPVDLHRLAEGLSDDKRLNKILDDLSDKQRFLLMDLFELGGHVSWDVLTQIYGDELDNIRAMLIILGEKGIVFQGGLTGRDPLILLPSLYPLIEEIRRRLYKSPDDIAWKEAGHLDIWGHIVLINTIRSGSVRCRSGMEPFKRGWEFLEEKLGFIIDLKRLYWELVELGCILDKKGIVSIQHGACVDLAMDGDARYPIWRFIQSCKPYQGIEYKVFAILKDRALPRKFFSRCLFLYLVSKTPELVDARHIIDDLIDLWISFGVLQEDETGKMLRFAGNIYQALKTGDMDVPLQSYSDEVIIQPTMEVLVPKDFDPVDLLNIGEIADIVRSDVVSIYRLTRRSIFRALREGWNSEKIVNFLDRISKHEVPENVLKTVTGWSSSHREAHIIKGTFLVFPDAKHKVPQGLEEVLPGIFKIPEKCDDDVVAFLDKRDVMVRGMDIVWETEVGINWGRMLPLKEIQRLQWKSTQKGGVYPFGMVTPLPFGTKGEVIFEEALHDGKSLIIFYPRQGYGEIQVKKISPVYIYRKGGVPFVEAFCEDTGEGEIFDISKVRALFKKD